MEATITPIFVFDGKPPDIKSDTLSNRHGQKVKVIASLADLDKTSADYKKMYQRSYQISSSDIANICMLLELMGVPYIMAPGEADSTCAWLAMRRGRDNRRYAKGVYSDDGDMLALGAPYLFKNISSKSRKQYIRIISLAHTETQMNLTHSMFIDLCVLLGTDYSTNLPGIGPKSAYKLILEYQTLPSVLEHLREWKPTVYNTVAALTIGHQMLAARQYYQTAVDQIDDINLIPDESVLQLSPLQDAKLTKFMCRTHGFDVARIDKAIDRLRVAHQKISDYIN